MLNTISKFALRADQTLNFTYTVSLITNIVDRVAKASLSRLSKSYSQIHKKLENSPFIKQINQKYSDACVFLATSFLYIAHRRNAASSDSSDSDSDLSVDKVLDGDDAKEIASELMKANQHDSKMRELVIRKTLFLVDFLGKMPKSWLTEQNIKKYKDIKGKFEINFTEAFHKGDFEQMEKLFEEIKESLNQLKVEISKGDQKKIDQKKHEIEDEQKEDGVEESLSLKKIEKLISEVKGLLVETSEIDTQEQKQEKQLELIESMSKLFSDFMSDISIEWLNGEDNLRKYNDMKIIFDGKFTEASKKCDLDQMKAIITEIEKALNELKENG